MIILPNLRKGELWEEFVDIADVDETCPALWIAMRSTVQIRHTIKPIE